ncbi:MAG: hypothetical protein ACI84E_000002 [Planctomycetota bacterium]|jgi:hypothetical protein
MQALRSKGLLLGAAVLLSGCVNSYYSGDSTYSRMVSGHVLPILIYSSTVDGSWTGSAGGSSSYGGPTGWNYESSWSGEVECEDSQIEQLGKDLFDSLRMDIFARGFEVATDSEVTFLEAYSPGANPAIQLKITHTNARNKGTIKLSAYAKAGDAYLVKLDFNESSI